MAESHGSGSRSRAPRLFAVGVSLAALAAVLGLYQLAALAIEKVRTGHGLETYQTFWLVEFSYVGVLIFFLSIVVALVVAVFFWWREERLWRDLERRYGANDPA